MTHRHRHRAPFILFCREACRLEEEGQEDEVAWEGLSPNRSICFLVCPSGWLLAPAQLLHSLQPDTVHTHNWTAHIKTTMLTGLSIFAKLFLYKEGKVFQMVFNKILMPWAKDLANNFKWTSENVFSVSINYTTTNFEQTHLFSSLEILFDSCKRKRITISYI